MDYQQLPKIELHLHLDCSLSFKVVKQLAPEISFAEYEASFIAPPKCTDLADYISRAIKGVDLMQTAEQLRLVTLDLFEQLKADNVVYAELRFAPLLHTNGGLTPTDVVKAVNDATIEGKRQTGIEAGIILCTLRHFSKEQSMKTVEMVNAWKGSCVVGFDIAADEAGFPIDNHVNAFQYAKEHSILCTAHAGEEKGAASVWETLNHFHPHRIGHGVRSAEDDLLLSFLKENHVHLEVCPTSNIQVNVYERIEGHSANKLFDAGISLSINTDARTISNVTLTSEYNTLETFFDWTKQHFKKCNLEAIQHAFTGEPIKEKLRLIIEDAYR
ncbi:MAG: adenosine deaminase [Bacteroidota bacterium]